MCYILHNANILAIINMFKNEQHNPKNYKNKVLILLNHNKLHLFWNMRSLSFSKFSLA